MSTTAQRKTDMLALLEPQDLELLRSLPREELAGTIIRLNRTPRYHNGLDAVRLVHRLIAERAPEASASSPLLPASSGSKLEEASSDTNFTPVQS